MYTVTLTILPNGDGEQAQAIRCPLNECNYWIRQIERPVGRQVSMDGYGDFGEFETWPWGEKNYLPRLGEVALFNRAKPELRELHHRLVTAGEYYKATELLDALLARMTDMRFPRRFGHLLAGFKFIKFSELHSIIYWSFADPLGEEMYHPSHTLISARPPQFHKSVTDRPV